MNILDIVECTIIAQHRNEIGSKWNSCSEKLQNCPSCLWKVKRYIEYCNRIHLSNKCIKSACFFGFGSNWNISFSPRGS